MYILQDSVPRPGRSCTIPRTGRSCTDPRTGRSCTVPRTGRSSTIAADKRGSQINIFLVCPGKCGYPLECTQHKFSWRNKENVNIIWLKKSALSEALFIYHSLDKGSSQKRLVLLFLHQNRSYHTHWICLGEMIPVSSHKYALVQKLY